MNPARRWLLGALLIAGAVVPWQSPASAVTPARFVSGWIPYFAITDGVRGLDAGAANVMADVSPFVYTARSATEIGLSGSAEGVNTSVSKLRANGLPVIPSVTDGSGTGTLAAVMADPTARTQHVAALVALTVGNGYDGVDLDYEGFAFADGRATWPSTQPNWVTFVTDLGAALHANGKLLSITVPAIWDNATSGYTVYAWASIIGAIDRLRIMVYDWSVGSPGPIAPLSWVNNVIAFTTSVIPAAQLRKVQLGVPSYGRNWGQVTSGLCPANADTGRHTLQMEDADALIAAKGASPVRDPSGEMNFTYINTFTGTRTAPLDPPVYEPPTVIADAVPSAADATALSPAVRLAPPSGTVTCTVRRTVYYPDEYSVIQRAQAAQAAGFSGIAMWAYGYETPQLWSTLAAMDWPRPAGNATTGALDAVSRVGDAVRVTGWAMDPEFDLPVTVTIDVGGVITPVVARLQRPDLPDALPGASPLHGFDTTFSIPATPTQVCMTATGWGPGAAPISIGCVMV